jgi:hypothetical protein
VSSRGVTHDSARRDAAPRVMTPGLSSEGSNIRVAEHEVSAHRTTALFHAGICARRDDEFGLA